MNRLDNKSILITGGARGPGAAEAKLCIAAGVQLVIADGDDAEGLATAERLGDARSFIPHDVSSEKYWQNVVG